MKISLGLFAAFFAVFCLIGVLVVFPKPIESASSAVYNPWADVDNDGVITILDVVKITGIYGTKGTPMTKAGKAYDSGWMDIHDKQGQYFSITPNIGDLNTLNCFVQVYGKAKSDGAAHSKYYYGNGMPGFNTTYGGSQWDGAESVVQTSDGGYAIAGQTSSYGAGTYDAYLVKTDLWGNLLWNKTYGGTGDDAAYSMVQTADGGFALAGVTESYGTSIDFYLVKADSSGNMQWNKTYGGTGEDVAKSVLQTSDGGYTLAGETSSYGAGSYDSYLVKTDGLGNTQWTRTYGGISNEETHAFVQTSDGGYALVGPTLSYGVGKMDVYLVKADAYGLMELDIGVAISGSTSDTIILYRGKIDPYYNYIRIQIWVIP